MFLIKSLLNLPGTPIKGHPAPVPCVILLRMNDQLWAPWRIEYILKEKQSDGCIFCQKLKEDDDKKNYILERGSKCFTIMNIYPYNNGHLMVIPNRHVANIEELETSELTEIMQLIKRSVMVLKNTVFPEGFNIGANIGRLAGAGIADHIHFHIVPRWTADTNFMPVVANTNVIPEGLNQTYDKLIKAFGDIDEPPLER